MASSVQVPTSLRSGPSVNNDERKRHFKLTDYEMESTNKLRDFMHRKLPKDKILLYKRLESHKAHLLKLKNMKVIKEYQWKLMFPANGETDSDTFDITIITILLRNICNLNRWEMSLVDECAALRNSVAHHGKSIQEKEYNNFTSRFKTWFKHMGMSEGEWSILKNRKIYNDVGNVRYGLKNPVDNFIGRELQLQQLHAALQDHDTVVIKGLSGVGKSELVKMYCHQHGNDYENNILFINSETVGTLESFFVNFALSIDLLSLDDTKLSIKMEVLVPQVYNFLSTKNCLLIFDNADRENILVDFMPTTPSKSKRKIIITTQLQIWRKHTNQIQLQPLELKEGLLFFQKEGIIDTNSAESKESAEKLVKALSSLPIALRLASSYISTRDISISAFLKEHEEKFEKLWSKVEQDGMNENAKTVLTTWDMALDRLGNDQHAIRLLQMFSLMDGKSIDEALLVHLDCVEEDELKESLCKLKTFSLIGYEVKGNRSFFLTMHNLVQQVTRARLTDEEQIFVINRLFQMCQDFENKSINKNHQNFGDLWLQHIFSAMEKIRIKLPTSDLFLDVIEHSISASISGGKLKSATTLINNCKKIFPASLQLTHTEADILYLNGNYDETIELYREVLKSLESTLGPEHPSTLITKHNIGVSLDSQGKYDEAMELYREVLKSQESVLGPEHPSTLNTKNNMAVSLNSKGKYDEAIELYRKVLKSQESALGPEHPSTLNTKHNVALSLQSKGKYDEAMELYRELLKSLESTLGPEHPLTFITKHNMAVSLDSQGKYDEAMELYREVLKSQESALGPEHPSTLSTKHNIAVLLDSKGKYDEAMELYREVLKSQESALGPEHPSTLNTKHNMAVSLKSKGKYDEPMELYREVLKSQESVLGPEHPSTLNTKNNMAVLLESKGKYDEAMELYQEVLKSQESVHGPEHPSTLNT